MSHVLCHIVGLSKKSHTSFKNMVKKQNNSEVKIIDLDTLAEEIIDSTQIANLYSQYQKLALDKDKHSLQGRYTRLKIKKLENRMNAIERKINISWKLQFKEQVDNLILSTSKRIIFIGDTIFAKNYRTYIDIPTSLKIYLDGSQNENIEEIISHNLDNHRKNIIRGDFPIKYLDYSFLSQKISSMQKAYQRQGYLVKDMNQVKSLLKRALQNSKNLKQVGNLFIASQQKYQPGQKIKGNPTLFAYTAPWIAMVSALPADEIRKGYIYSNKPYIEEKKKNAFRHLKQRCYLYQVDLNSFQFDSKKGKNYRLYTNSTVRVKKRTYIASIYQKLSNLKIKFLDYYNGKSDSD